MARAYHFPNALELERSSLKASVFAELFEINKHGNPIHASIACVKRNFQKHSYPLPCGLAHSQGLILPHPLAGRSAVQGGSLDS